MEIIVSVILVLAFISVLMRILSWVIGLGCWIYRVVDRAMDRMVNRRMNRKVKQG